MTTRFPENMNRQHAWTVQKNSRKDAMANQKTAMTFVKKTELENADSEDCCKLKVTESATVREISHQKTQWIAEKIE